MQDQHYKNKFFANKSAGFISLVVAIFLLAVLSGCQTLQPNFETPTVKLVSIAPLPVTGLEQRFAIGLRVANPNARALNLAGMTYVIELEGFKVVDGVANKLPSIPAYGESLVDIEASVSLLEGMRLLSSFLSKPKADVSYKIVAKLDTGLPFVGKIPVSDSGVIDFSQ